MAIYDPQILDSYYSIHNHISTNHKIFEHIYNYKVISDNTIISEDEIDHRIVVWDGGITEYMQKFNGMLVYHRIGAPAIESEDPNFNSFYVWGGQHVDVKEYCYACGFDDIDTMAFILKYGQDLPYF